jgi:hypothetical protein
MKVLIAIMLMAGMLFGIIFSLDVIGGASLKGLVWKSINPLRVMEPAEYIIIFLFLFFFCIDILGSYLNSKKNKNPTN